MGTSERAGSGGPALALIAVGIILLGSLGGAAYWYLMAGTEQIDVHLPLDPDLGPPPVTPSP